MAKYIPTTEYVREAYRLSEWSFYAADNGGAVPGFDRWLAEVKTEAWDRALGDLGIDESLLNIRNPYRGEQA